MKKKIWKYRCRPLGGLHFFCRKYRSDISGITRKSAAKNLIGEADFLMRGMLGLGNIAMRYFLE